MLSRGNFRRAKIVGYMNVERKANTLYSVGGNMFVTPGQQTCDLVDFKIVGGDYSSDTISFVQDDAPYIDTDKIFYYISAEESGNDDEWTGWWYNDGSSKVESFPIPAGTGFMCNFTMAGTKIIYSGEVQKGSDGVIEIERGNNQLYRFIGNPVPAPVDLLDVKVVGGDYSSDTISFLLKEDSIEDSDRVYYYISAEESGNDDDWTGWWLNDGSRKVERNEVVLAPGEGFFAYMTMDGSKIVFPAPKL